MLEIKASHDFEMHLNFKRDLTGTLNRISMISSDGRVGVVKIDSCIEFDENFLCVESLQLQTRDDCILRRPISSEFSPANLNSASDYQKKLPF